ncbi:hypothetical protein F5Y16DRAFT_406808 [Xylariaceae sp. FL0255]|nr:hypothetical protein F5Y16DRAFT_406808 [Xylariaceae sp. FL0255]
MLTISYRDKRPNRSSIHSPPPVNVTVTNLKPAYAYSPAKLWIAHGSAIVAAALALALGILAMGRNNASFNADFSSILRATYGAVLNITMQRQDIQMERTASQEDTTIHPCDWDNGDTARHEEYQNLGENNTNDQRDEDRDNVRPSHPLYGHSSLEPTEEITWLPAPPTLVRYRATAGSGYKSYKPLLRVLLSYYDILH